MYLVLLMFTIFEFVIFQKEKNGELNVLHGDSQKS